MVRFKYANCFLFVSSVLYSISSFFWIYDSILSPLFILIIIFNYSLPSNNRLIHHFTYKNLTMCISISPLLVFVLLSCFIYVINPKIHGYNFYFSFFLNVNAIDIWRQVISLGRGEVLCCISLGRGEVLPCAL